MDFEMAFDMIGRSDRQPARRAALVVGALVRVAFVTFALAGAMTACGIGLTAPSAGSAALTSVDGGRESQDASASGNATVTAPLGAVADSGSIAADALAMTESPLCNHSLTSVCDPDETGCSAGCAQEVLGDAGTPAVAQARCARGEGFACHVTAVRGDGGVAEVVPACTVAKSGVEEDPCTSSDSCAAGYECVINAVNLDPTNVDAAKAGVCRRYCCDNVCGHAESFCDIETEIGGSVAVPVCVDLASTPSLPGAGGYGSCQLLKDSCPTGLACQIVDQRTGLVACVTPGSSTAGQSCEVDKCAAGFSCIGQFPYRQCAQLCNVDNPNDCMSGTCTQNTALSSNDSIVGVCAQ
jgi:hypothetical protein